MYPILIIYINNRITFVRFMLLSLIGHVFFCQPWYKLVTYLTCSYTLCLTCNGFHNPLMQTVSIIFTIIFMLPLQSPRGHWLAISDVIMVKITLLYMKTTLRCEIRPMKPCTLGPYTLIFAIDSKLCYGGSHNVLLFRRLAR